MAAISTAIAVAGLGLAAAGAYNSYQGAKGQAAAQERMTQVEMQQEKVRQQAMELSAKRQQMEVLRNSQRARSVALSNANSQGAQFGSGLAGGYGQISGQTGVNLLGINQNLEFGEQMFNLNNQLSQAKISYAQAGTQSSLGSGLSSLGGTLIGNASTLGNISKGFGFGANSNYNSYGQFISGIRSNGIY